jgi:UDP-N-acetylglucosamine diphosphorylase/glucosamine-1-phosphate N-acetyltransferase
MHICLFEDTQYGHFLPLAHLRPLYELRCGASTLKEKLVASLPGAEVSLHVRPDLAGFWREEHSAPSVNALPERDTWFINGRVIADRRLARLVRSRKPRQCAYFREGDLAAFYLEGRNIRALLDRWPQPIGPEDVAGIPAEPLDCTMARYAWDLVTLTSGEIEKALGTASPAPGKSSVDRRASLLNRKSILIGRGSIVKPGAVLDATHGPVLLGRNVTVLPNAMIEGPAFIGDHTIVKAGAKIYHGTSIGPHCKVGGEVEASVIQSYSNKQHDGFLGHSYLGSWVNIGAGTNTSDLKNTYGHVRVRLGGREIDTGMQFLGLTMGDHSLAGINSMFDAGTVVGVSCNLFGTGIPPKFVPSFSWGGAGRLTLYDLEKAIATARRMMVRREVAMSAAYEARLREHFLMTRDERTGSGVS